MTPKLPQPRRARRAALGAELKRLRELNGVSGRTVAKALGVSQSAVSRKEAGDAPVSLPEVTAWAGAIHASDDDRSRLLWMAEQAVTETIPLEAWRAEAGAAGIQQDIGTLERASRFIANFQPDFVPGLLQTGEYARRVLTMAGNPDPAAAALKRLDRQTILHDQSHRLEFIVTEAGLRWCTGPTDMLVPQLDRVATLATLRNVTVSVIPLGADWRTAPPYPFVLYDERGDGGQPIAVTELPDQRIETANVEPYRSELDKLRRSALSGDEAVAYILRLARGLSGEWGPDHRVKGVLSPLGPGHGRGQRQPDLQALT